MINSVQYLQSIHFSTLTFQEKCEIKHRGRPTPMLDIKQSSTSRQKEYTRSFNSEVYKKFEWLSGCDIKNALFCFPCILFGGDSSWTQKGITDLRKLHEKINKHAKSEKHLNNSVNIAMLRRANIEESLSSAHKQAIERHNNDVRKNREVLSRIIDCIKFCGINELALRGHNENADSDNQGIFLNLIKYTGEIDSLFKSHLETSSPFKGISKTIQNELLECMLEVFREEILSEIEETEFVSVLADETTDISEKFQLVIVLRYCNKEGKVVERFYGFFNPTGQDANSISECILSQLEVILKSKKDKLIGQSYDGAAVMERCIKWGASKNHGLLQICIFCALLCPSIKFDNGKRS